MYDFSKTIAQDSVWKCRILAWVIQACICKMNQDILSIQYLHKCVIFNAEAHRESGHKVLSTNPLGFIQYSAYSSFIFACLFIKYLGWFEYGLNYQEELHLTYFTMCKSTEIQQRRYKKTSANSDTWFYPMCSSGLCTYVVLVDTAWQGDPSSFEIQNRVSSLRKRHHRPVIYLPCRGLITYLHSSE